MGGLGMGSHAQHTHKTTLVAIPPQHGEVAAILTALVQEAVRHRTDGSAP